MNNLIHVMLIFCGAWLLLLLLCQPAHALRIKRADNLANATSHLKQNKEEADTLKAAAAAAAATASATATAAAVDVMLTNGTENEIVKAAAAAAATATPVTALVETKPEMQEDDLNLDYIDRLRHARRRMALIDDSLLPRMGRRVRQPGANAAPPYVYYNKLISPDGKQELKEFQLLAPNVVIESVQHDVNYGPGQELGGVLLLNADSNGHIRGPAKPVVKHQKHKAGLPPFLYLLQQMLQPNLNLDMDAQYQRNHMDMPLYQFLDNAMDNALHNNNRESIEHVLGEQEQRDEQNDIKDKEKESSELQSLKLEDTKDDSKFKAADVMTNRKDDELIVSCPIHHEHHASNNGDIIDDDVVLVNECHIV